VLPLCKVSDDVSPLVDTPHMSRIPGAREVWTLEPVDSEGETELGLQPAFEWRSSSRGDSCVFRALTLHEMLHDFDVVLGGGGGALELFADEFDDDDDDDDDDD
jgi:hypothetical protein